MPRFVIIAKSDNAHPEDLKSIYKLSNVILIDEINNKAALIEAPSALLDELRIRLPGWIIEAEQFHSTPF